MKAETVRYRRRGRPTLHRDKNGRSIPMRADRDLALKWFFKNVPHAGFDEALLMSGDQRFYRLHDALHDDACRRTSPGTLCRRFGISLSDLDDLWRSHNLSLGMLLMANHLPQVMEQLAEDSLSREEACPQCDVIGSVPDVDTHVICPLCDGVGKIRVPGDAQALRLLFKMLRLIGP